MVGSFQQRHFFRMKKTTLETSRRAQENFQELRVHCLESHAGVTHIVAHICFGSSFSAQLVACYACLAFATLDFLSAFLHTPMATKLLIALVLVAGPGAAVRPEKIASATGDALNARQHASMEMELLEQREKLLLQQMELLQDEKVILKEKAYGCPDGCPAGKTSCCNHAVPGAAPYCCSG